MAKTETDSLLDVNEVNLAVSQPRRLPGAGWERIVGRVAACRPLITTVSLIAVLWLSILTFGQTPAPDQLDPSWMQSLGHAYVNNFQFGIDYIFTYGPLGYYYNPASTYDSALFYKYIAWQFVICLFIATYIVIAALRIRGSFTRHTYLFLAVVVLSIFQSPLRFLVSILVAVSLIMTPPAFIAISIRRHLALLGSVLIFLSVAAVARFSCLILAVVGVACVSGVHALSGESTSRKLSIAIPVSFVFCFLATWCLAGQSLLTLPSFISNSLQIISGYADAMSADGAAVPLAKTQIHVAFWCILALSSLMILRLLRRPRRWARMIEAVFFLCVLFLAWKNGFVRHDPGHLAMFFGTALAMPFLIECQQGTDKHWTMVFAALRYAAALLAMFGLFQSWKVYGYGPASFVGTWNQRIVTNLERVFTLKQQRAAHEQELSRLKQRLALPTIRRVVGHRSVDIFFWEQGMALINGLNWTPRPVSQSYAAFTPKLTALNADFFLGSKAPRYAIIKMQTIDGQFPLMQDSAALAILLRDYRPLLQEKGYLLLERAPRKIGRVPAGKTLVERRLRFGETLDLSRFNEQALLISFHLEKTWLGRLSSLLYKAPTIEMEVKTAGWTRRFRVIPGMVRQGVLINPLILDQFDLVDWYLNHKQLKKVKSLRLSVKPNVSLPRVLAIKDVFRPQVSVKVSEFSIPPYPVSKMTRARIVEFPSFHTLPYDVTSPHPRINMRESGKRILIVCAPGTMRFHLSPGRHHLTAQFGIMKDCYNKRQVSPTDGVEFVAVLERGKGRDSLFRRFLNPMKIPGDRGILDLGPVSFTTTKKAQLLLLTLPGPRGDSSCDWSFWRSVKITSSPLGR